MELTRLGHATTTLARHPLRRRCCNSDRAKCEGERVGQVHPSQVFGCSSPEVGTQPAIYCVARAKRGCPPPGPFARAFFCPSVQTSTSRPSVFLRCARTMPHTQAEEGVNIPAVPPRSWISRIDGSRSWCSSD